MSHTDTAIIGAGPYGLSLSAHLSSAGVPHEVFGEPMQAWKNNMPHGMLLRSEAFATSLFAPVPGYTLKDYLLLKNRDYQSVGMRLPLQTFIDYALWFQGKLVPHVRIINILSLYKRDGLFNLQFSDGSSWTARRVVLALGLKEFENLPPMFQKLSKPFITHSAEIADLSWSGGKDIVIVGGGQSALGLAALLHECGARTRVLIRDQRVSWNQKPLAKRSIFSKLVRPEAGLGPGWRSHIFSEYPFIFYWLSHAKRKKIIDTSWGPSGAWWLYDRVLGKTDLQLGSQVTSVALIDGKVRLEVKNDRNTSSMTTDHVIVATGFKINMKRHTFISTDLIKALSLIDGAPHLTPKFETNIQDLYIIGPASAYSFGPVMRFIYGAKYMAPLLARHIRKKYQSLSKLEC